MRTALEIAFILSAYVVFDASLLFLGVPAAVRRLVALALAALITAIYLRSKKSKPKQFFDAWGIKKSPALSLAVCAVLGVSLNAICSSVIALLPSELTASYAASAAPLGALTLVGIVDTVMLAPLVEELIFRHAVLGRLRTIVPCAAALAASALLFGAFHGGVIWIIYATLCGLALGALYLKYDSLLPPLVMHAAFNGANYLFLLLPPEASAYVLACAAVLASLSALYIIRNKK
jgi:membrane protease YdiL (CAAX protease family)